MFVDNVNIRVKAGKGGDGVVSFRREPFVDHGGPNGGDGGKGGDVVLRVDPNLNTLASYRLRKLHAAKEGRNGATSNRHGKSGDDLVVPVPAGTSIYLDDELVADLVEIGQEQIVARGGSGGFGNAHFTSSRRQAPNFAEKGEPGDEMELNLELKLLADVGIIGLPNAGKSTFLSVVSNARPEIADYEFTTLSPNLGVADLHGQSLLLADIPGLIEGASEGKGLGDEFLRHVERTAVLLHLVDAYSNDVAKSYQTIRNELKGYRVDLSEKPQLLVLSKCDGLDDEIINDQVKQLKKASGNADVMILSSLSRLGLEPVLAKLIEIRKKVRAREKKEATEQDSVVKVTLIEPKPWQAEKLKDGSFRVTGFKIEKFARRTDFENEDGIRRLKDIMGKMGINNTLHKQGINTGDTVKIGKSNAYQFEY